MKQLCAADVTGTSVADRDSNRIDYLQSAVYDCAGTYQNGFTEPAVATAGSTSLGSWVDVTGVYTPTSGQNHDAACHASCATTACSSWANDAAILHTTSGCSGCAPRNPQTDAGCFPGAAGYPTAVSVLHRIGGLTSNKYYAFRIAAFNHFGTGAWSTQSYAVHTHSAPTAPKWAASPVTAVAAAGTGLTLNWAAGDAYGTGTDECLGRDVSVTGTFSSGLVLDTPDANGRVISAVDNYYNGMVITTSTNGGESRVITGYTGSTRAVTLSSAFTTANPTGATFTIGPAHRMTATLSCSRSKAQIFAECDTDHNAALSTAEVTACSCVSARGDGTATGVTYALESCSTAGYGASDSGSETNSGTHTYTIQQCSGSSCAPTITKYTTTSTTQAVTGLTAGTTYVFKVTATNAAGSTSSQTTTYTTPGLPDKPDPPVALTIEGTEIKLSWLASIDKVVSSVSGHDTVGPANNGFILYAQSYDVVTSTWVAAVRGSLTHDGEDQIAAAEYAQGRSASATNPNIAYASDSGSTVIDGYLQLAHFSNEYYTNAAGAQTAKPSSGSWNHRGLANRVNVVDTVVVPALMAGTRYRFKVALVNAAGTSARSDASEEYTTPDSAISNVRIYSGPPCAYKPGQGGATTFAASAEGSNVKYTWELVAQDTTGQSTLYSDATMRPGGSTIGKCLDGSTCSVMEYTLPYPGDDSSYHASYDEIKLRVLASNGRGIVAEEIAFGYNSVPRSQLTGVNTIEYCGCTDPGDDMYWPEATFMVPSLCTTDTFDSADASSVGSSNVASGDWEYFQFFFDADSYAAEVTVRVDVGTVDVFVSTTEIPDASLPHTFSASQTGVSNFYVASLSYAQLSASTQRSVFVAVKGAAGFSRFQVLGRSSEFQLAPGSDSPSPASRERLRDVSSSPAGITKTVLSSGWNFFEFYYPHSDNDIDVQITITSSTAATAGLLDVYASLTERYPSPERATSSYSGYWTGTGHSLTSVSSAAVAAMTFTIRPTSHTGRDGALYVGVNGKAPSGWSVGNELTSSTYTITAKVFRYTIASSLLDPVVGVAASSVSTGTTVAGSIGAVCAAPCTAPTLSSSSSSVDDFYVGMVLTIGNAAQAGTMSAALTLQTSNGHGITLNYYKDWTIATSAPSGSGTITASTAADPPVLTVSWNSGTITTTTSTTYTLTPPVSQQSQSLTVTDYVGATKVATVLEGFTIPITAASTFSIHITGTDAVARTAAAEDRYAVASRDNFNYYEIATSDATKSLTLTLTVHYGTAKLFTSTASLPTQDQTVSTLLGTYAASPSAVSISVLASSTNIEGKYVYLGVFGSGGDTSYDLVVTENTFGVAAPTQLYWCDEGTDVRSYTTSTVAVDAACTTLPGALYPVCDDNGAPSTVACPLCTEALATLIGTFSSGLVLDTPDANGRAISTVDNYYNGMVITTSTNGGESRVITGYTGSTRAVTLSSGFTTADPTGATFTINTGTCEPSACRCSAGNTLGADTFTTLAGNSDAGHFFALYLGTEDARMQTASRSGAGSLPSDISGSSSAWGLDWTTPMTTTWIDSKTDEWDMDVDISFARGGLQTGAAQSFRVFASTRERYPSDERAYDAAVATASVHYDAESMYRQAGLPGKKFATSGTGACTLLKAQSTPATYGLCLAACDTLAGRQTGTFAVDGNGVVSLPATVATSENYYAGWTVVTVRATETGQMGAALTLQASNSHATTLNYYKDWTITTGAAEVGTITGSTAVDPTVLTVSWHSGSVTTTSSTTYTLTPPPTVGTIRTSTQTSTSDTTPVVTFSWLPAGSSVVAGGTTYAGSSSTPSISSTTTYTLYPPSTSSTLCNAAQFTATGTVCQLFSCPSNAASYLVAGAADDQTYLKSTDSGSLVVPMYTFSGKWVYINIENSNALTGHLQITKTEKTSVRGVSTDPASSGTRCTSAFCNNNGNCIDDSTDGEHKLPYCICSDGYSGADCSIKAFSPATTISTSASFVGSVATGYKYGLNAPGLSHTLAGVTGTMSAALTLAAGATVSKVANYYVGWTITTANPTATGTITSNDIAGVLTVSWTTTGVTTTSSTTYTLSLPAGCRTQHQWQANGALNGVAATLAGSLTLPSGYSGYDDYYNGLTITVGAPGAGTYTITDYVGSSKTFVVAEAAAAATTGSSSFVINTCATGHTWNAASKTCKRYSGPDPHEWEPFVYIGVGYLQHCSPIENLVPATAAVGDCQALCGYTGLRLVETGTMSAALTLASGSHKRFTNYYNGWTITITAGAAVGLTGVITSSSTTDGPVISVDWQGTPVNTDGTSEYTLTPPETSSACNAFVHDGTSTAKECKLYTCPTGSAPATTAAATREGSWGVDETLLKKAYHRAPLTCCASNVDNVASDGLTCANPVPGYYDKASCETVVGVTSAGKCEQSAATSRAACEDAPATTVEATCELKPFDEVSDAGCSPAAIRAGRDGSSAANSCDAYDVVKLDCSTQKCTPSPSNANPYKIGYVSCVGGVCTINAPKPIVEVPFTVAGLPEYSKVLAYVDSKPYPSKGANALHYTYNCESSDTSCVSSTSKPSFADSSIKIYDLQPLPPGKKHTLVLMLLTSEGEPLGTVLKQFEVGYAGGCAVAPDGSVCGNQGACHLGYCVCYDGYFGTDCERNIDEDGSVCAAKSSTTAALCAAADGNGATPGFGNYQCNWDAATALCSIQVVTTGFTAGGVYQARQTQLANSKLGEARFLNTRMLEANAAEIKQSDNAIASGTAGTKTKLETVAASVVATVAASKTATQTSVDALYAKAERNAIKVQQAKEESLRLQTTNLEAKLEMQRSLADHQTQVQNRFQSKRFDVYKLNAQKQDKLKQEFARTRFTLNQLLTSNGPTVDPTKFKQSTCTTDQFYNVVCSESTVDQSASFAGTGYVSGQTVDTANTVGTRAAPVVVIEGADTVGQYNDVNRGR